MLLTERPFPGEGHVFWLAGFFCEPELCPPPLAMFESFCFLCQLPFLWNSEAHLLGQASVYSCACA